jgi:imidazolonepropionase
MVGLNEVSRSQQAKPPLLIRSARQLLTLRGAPGLRRGPTLSQLGIIEDGALLIADGKIAAVGPSRRLENLSEARGARTIDAGGRVVMPGLVDCHAMLISGPAIFGTLPTEEAAQEASAASTQSVEDSSGPRLKVEAMKMIRVAARHGTTTLEAKQGYGFTEAAEVKALRALAKVNRQPVEIIGTLLAGRLPPEFSSPAGYFSWMSEVVLPRVCQRGLARFADVVMDPESGFQAADAAGWLRTARAAGLAVKMHTHRRRPSDSLALALELEAFSVDHLNCIRDGEVRALASANTAAVLLPAPVFHTGKTPYAPGRAMADQGVPIALGSGFDHNECPIISMQVVISLACRFLGLAPEEAIVAATANGACAVGLGDRLGTLEYGKDADVLLLNVEDYRALAHYHGHNLVAMTLKCGEVVHKQGEVKPLES